MKDLISTDLRSVRVRILEMKCSLNDAMDLPDVDADKLSDAYDKLSDAYDALCEAAEILGGD